MVEHPPEKFREIIEFCGLEWDEGVLDFHLTKKSVKTASVVQVRKPLYKTSVGRWRRYEAQLQPLVGGLRA